MMLATALAFGLASLVPPTLEVRTRAEGQISPPAKIEDLSFLAGHWVGEGLGACAEETIALAVDGQMMGMFRQMKPEGGLSFYEFYTFAEEGGTIVLKIKHFNPDLSGWEEKDASVEFPLLAIEGTTAYFDGLTYARSGRKTQHAAVIIGEKDVAQFNFHAAKKGESCASAARP